MLDEKLIEMIAEIWVKNGADALGFDYCNAKIKDKIIELINRPAKGREE